MDEIIRHVKGVQCITSPETLPECHKLNSIKSIELFMDKHHSTHTSAAAVESFPPRTTSSKQATRESAIPTATNAIISSRQNHLGNHRHPHENRDSTLVIDDVRLTHHLRDPQQKATPAHHTNTPAEPTAGLMVVPVSSME